MFIELAFVACLAHEQDTCRENSLLFMDVPIMTCLLHGQTQLASWTEQHPDWQIKSWKCGFPDTASADI